jgi:hypothetical protein
MGRIQSRAGSANGRLRDDRKPAPRITCTCLVTLPCGVAAGLLRRHGKALAGREAEGRTSKVEWIRGRDPVRRDLEGCGKEKLKL